MSLFFILHDQNTFPLLTLLKIKNLTGKFYSHVENYRIAAAGSAMQLYSPLVGHTFGRASVMFVFVEILYHNWYRIQDFGRVGVRDWPIRIFSEIRARSRGTRTDFDHRGSENASQGAPLWRNFRHISAIRNEISFNRRRRLDRAKFLVYDSKEKQQDIFILINVTVKCIGITTPQSLSYTIFFYWNFGGILRKSGVMSILEFCYTDSRN